MQKQTFYITNITCDPDEVEEFEASNRFEAIKWCLQGWFRSDYDIRGAFDFLKNNGIDHGVCDDDIDEGSDDIIRRAGRQILQIIRGNPIKESEFLEAVKESLIIRDSM